MKFDIIVPIIEAWEFTYKWLYELVLRVFGDTFAFVEDKNATDAE